MPNDLCQPYPVPVVRALIADAAGRVLLLQRAATAYGPGQWCLPGGKVDYGQTLVEALAREIREETALELRERESDFWIHA
ncbi:MAG: NUDIX domain-containing protein [Deltaproteobacteria bacterium]|nr:NUDIX domain-containing protein [Deltaproteobacteria bacterium]